MANDTIEWNDTDLALHGITALVGENAPISITPNGSLLILTENGELLTLPIGSQITKDHDCLCVTYFVPDSWVSG